METTIKIIIAVIAVFTFCYTMYFDFIYKWNAQPIFDIVTEEKIVLSNSLHNIVITPSVTIYNSGNKEGKISKIEAFLKDTKGDTKILSTNSYTIAQCNTNTSPKPFIINKGDSWSADINFTLPISEEELLYRDSLNISLIRQHSLITEENIKNKTDKRFFLSNNTALKVDSLFKANMNWLKIGNYILTINIYDKPHSEKPSWKRDFSFRMTSFGKLILGDYAPEPYKYSHPATFNNFINFYFTPTIKAE